MPLVTGNTLFSAILLAALSQGAAARAPAPHPAPLITPPAPAGVYLPRAVSAPDAEVRRLSPDEAKQLLTSTEGPAWRVFQVQAPACEKPVKNKRVSRKEARLAAKNCKQLAKTCKDAGKLARKYRARISCSALYPQTTVWLSSVNQTARSLK